MDLSTLREHCLAVKGATESLPFLHHNTLVFKVMEKMFCMAALEPSEGIFWADLKCDPVRSVELREKYTGVGPGHVKSTLLWNRIILESDVPDSLIIELIRHSAESVLEKLPVSRKEIYRKL